MFPDYSIVRRTNYGREVDYTQVGFINISERDIAALLNGEILDVVGDLPILIRFQHDDNLSFGVAVAKYMKDLPTRPLKITNEAVCGGDIVSFGSCPSCGYEVSSCMKYCLDCGQRLDWNLNKSR